MTMQDTPDFDIDDAPTAPLSFVFYLMGPEPSSEVIEYALDARPRVSADLRDGLNRAINNVAKVSGFRNASLAPPGYILPQLSQEIAHEADLAAAVARVWHQGQAELRNAVAAELEQRDVPLPGWPAPAEEVRVGASTRAVYEALQGYRDAHPDMDRNQVAFMFQLLTGVSDVDLEPEEADGVIPNLLEETLIALAAWPSTQPEWDGAIPEFSAALAKLIDRKQEQRQLVGPLEELFDSIAEEHGELLEFFQCDRMAWSLDCIGPEFPFQRAREQGERLRELLAQYTPIHDRAPVVSDEMARAARRAELVPQILDAAGLLQRMLDDLEESGDDPQTGADDAEPVCSCKSGSVGEDVRSTDSGRAEEPSELFSSVPACEIEGSLLLHLAYQDLEEENIDLEHENAGLKAQVKDLERQLYESRNREEGWQLAQTYQDQPTEEAEEPELADVNAAVELAMERYSDQLLFQLNAASDARNSDFTRPDRVWRALRWLATDYFSSHLGQTPIGNMNEACRLACDMWYKTSQHETTMTQFPNAYSTRIDGRLIWLREHIGRGTGFDPRYTIRIAFDWDRQLQKVVIGYIGQHQRTAAT